MALKKPHSKVSSKAVPGGSLPLVLVFLCFFLSGAAGLVYEILWVRMIDKVVGSAPFAVSTVLSAFMSGLALGSVVAGRIADRLNSRVALLRFYGIVEIAVGIYALLLPSCITLVEPIYRAAYNAFFSLFWAYRLFAFAGCLLLLILPTSLMGVTLPILCRFVVTHLEHLGTRTGKLYGLNTFGAALGSILCGFFLIANLGMWGTLVVAAGINILVGVSCILLSTMKERLFSPQPSRRAKTRKLREGMLPEGTPPPEPLPGKTATWTLWIFALSGFCAMAYQVFWTRLLGLLLGPTTYSFTLVVSTFIIGLALGNILFGRLADRVRNVFPLLILTQILAAGFAMVVSQFLGNSQFFFAKLIDAFQGGFGSMVAVQALVLFGVLLGPTLFLGASFPLVNRIVARSLPRLGGSIGTAYAVNTVGAIAGSFVSGFLLIPLVGKENGLRAVMALQFAAALAAFVHSEGSTGPRHRRWVPAASMAILGILALPHFPSWDRNILSRGWYRNVRDIRNELRRTGWLEAVWKGPAILARERKGLELVFYGDGIGGFTTVEKETTSLGIEEYALYNSGKPDASSHGDRSTQTLSGHLPLLFHPNPEKVMILGLASGMTPGEALHHPVRRMDILEINDQVVEACRLFFTPWNNDCLNDPRTRLIVQDGRNHLALTREKYDIIVSEPSNPWMAGLAGLYTLDFFEMVKARLREGGLFAQWIQSYELDWSTFALLGRTFTEVFPNGVLMKTGPGDYLLVGLTGGSSLDWTLAEKNMAHARKSTNASFAGSGFLVHLLVSEDLKGFFGNGPLHTDDRPRLEFSSPKKLYEGESQLDAAIAERRRLSPHTRALLNARSNPETLLDFVAFSASVNVPLFSMVDPETLSASERERYMAVVKHYCERVLVPSFHIFRGTQAKRECARIQVDGIKRQLATGGSRADDHYNLALALAASGQEEEALKELEMAVSMDPLHEDAHTALGLIKAQAGMMEEAERIFARVVEMSPGDAAALRNLGMAASRVGKTGEAITHLSAALRIEPHDVVGLNELGLALMKQGKVDEAIRSFTNALAHHPEDAESHNNLATALYRKGELEKAARHYAESLRIAPENVNVRYNLERVSTLLRYGRQGPGTSQEKVLAGD
ncbi:MAG: fused MFS/spermidine synthase [Deltaproteobacteria bacterium]|nr:fused MFS/spermidine synthase [Deltaproteobacteria bacterium]